MPLPGALGLLAAIWLPAFTGLAAERKPDVVFVPTPQAAVDQMLEMARLKPGDVVYDLGCGDGRIVVTAAKKYQVKAVGIDLDPQRVRESLANVKSNHVAHLVTIRQADLFQTDFREATVVTLYLWPAINAKLMPKLAQLKPGARILSFDFELPGARPVEVFSLEDDETGLPRPIYRYVVPWSRAPN